MKKKHLLSACLLLIAATCAQAATKIGDLYYTLNATDNTAAVARYVGDKYTGDITIPASVTDGTNTYAVTAIEDWAFYLCFDLTSVSIPNGVTTIGNSTFSICSALTSVTLPNSVTSIGYGTFSSCSALTSITLPYNLTSIGYEAFQHCSALTSITLPSSLTTIGDDAFYDCDELTSITIPAGVTSIGTGVLQGCDKLTTITVDNGNTTFDSRNNCNAIIEKATNTLIQGCNKSTIPDGIVAIGNDAFGWCSALTALSLPTSVTTIGENAFYSCGGLTSLTIPAGVTSIGKGAFADCTGVTAISVESGNTYYDSRNNCNAIIEKATNTLLTGCKNTIIPDGITTIGKSAFIDCAISSVSIPNSVTTIGEQAFYNCNLTSITIPASVTSIGKNAFWSNTNMTSIIAKAQTPPSCSGDAFNNVPYTATVCVPCGTAETYKAATGWSRFSNYTEQAYSITALSNDGNMGIATVTQQPTCENNVGIISATAYYVGEIQYRFKRWSDGNTDNPRTITVSSDTTLTAIFSSEYTISAVCIPAEGGTVTGTGDYHWKDSVTLEAVPNKGYTFSKWADDTRIQRTEEVTCNKTYTAYFTRNTYTITTASNDDTRGYVAGGGKHYYGEEVELNAYARTGYQFSKWSDGNTDNPRKITVEDNATYTAIFEVAKRTVTLTCDPEQGSVTGGGSYDHGTTTTIEATANTGYHFVDWWNVTANSQHTTANPFTFTVEQDWTFEARFEINTYTITATCDTTQGTVEGAGQYTHGATVTLTATPLSGYQFSHWGDDITDITNPRVFTAEEGLSITAHFTKSTSPDTGVDNIDTDVTNVQKVLSNGQVYILRSGKVFTTTGVEVK